MAKEASYFDGRKLKEGREVRGYSQTDFAAMIDVSKQSLSLYERNKQKPPFQVMGAIAQRLNLPLRFFVPDANENADVIYLRSYASSEELNRSRAYYKAGWLSKLSEYLSEFLDFYPVNLPTLDETINPLSLTNSEIEAWAYKVRAHWKYDMRPIPDVVRALEENGIITATADLGDVKVDGASTWVNKKPYVLLNKNIEAPGRRRFSAAHELGHLVLHRHLSKTQFDDNLKLCESQAHRFSSSFLLPDASFANDFSGASLETFALLKEKWRVSVAAMIHRCSDLNIIDKSRATSLWVQYSRRGWRHGEPLDNLIPIENPQLLCNGVKRLLDKKRVTIEDMLFNNPYSISDVEELTGFAPKALESQINRPVSPNLKFGDVTAQIEVSGTARIIKLT